MSALKEALSLLVDEAKSTVGRLQPEAGTDCDKFCHYCRGPETD